MNKKIIIAICIVSLVLVMPLASASLLDWFVGLFGDTVESPTNITDTEFYNIKELIQNI